MSESSLSCFQEKEEVMSDLFPRRVKWYQSSFWEKGEAVSGFSVKGENVRLNTTLLKISRSKMRHDKLKLRMQNLLIGEYRVIKCVTINLILCK